MKRLEMRRSEAHAAGLLNRPSAWILRSPPTLPGLGVHGETVSWDGSLREYGKVSRELEGDSTEEGDGGGRGVPGKRALQRRNKNGLKVAMGSEKNSRAL